ncbi:MAG: hypothetical protein ABJB11_04860 [Ferruginibacter sp.]
MDNTTGAAANQDIVIENVQTDSITVKVNGEMQEIKNGFEELKALLATLNAENFKSGDKIYNIGSITNATFSAEIGKKTFNMLLCRKLTEAIQDYSADAKSFLAAIKDSDKGNWETQSRYTRKANAYIISSYVGVLGILLRKLIASGQDASSSGNQKDYLEVCIATTKRTLQLLCFAFISRLWDLSTDKPQALGNDQLNALDNFFNSPVELNITDYVTLFKTMVSFFKEQQLDYPFSEIKEMEAALNDGSTFLTNCKNLQAISDKLDAGQYTLSTAFEAETELTEFLVTLKFLANYKMISVKDIAYEEIRSNTAQYLHAYTFLGVDNDSNMYSQKFKYDNNPISTDSILLFKDKYQDGLNLFPFIIDINALTNELEVKICFYTYYEENKKRLAYSDINKISSDKNDNENNIQDPSEVAITYNEEIENDIKASVDRDITRFKSDVKRFHDMQLNVVYKTFQLAKNIIVS